MNILDCKEKKAIFFSEALYLINDGWPLGDIHFYLCEEYYLTTQSEQDWAWSVIQEAIDKSDSLANSKIV